MTRTWTDNLATPGETDATSDIRYGYDPFGRLGTVSIFAQGGVTNTPTATTTYSYDTAGSLATIDRANGTLTRYGYDFYGRLSRLQTVDDENPQAGYEDVADFKYTRDAAGRITRVEERLLDGGGISTYKTQAVDYLFDDLGRLTQEKHNPGMTASTADDWQIDYIYDLVGNRLAKTRTAGGLVRERVLDSYNHLDQLVAEIVETHTYNNGVETIDSKSWLLEYDANGALIQKEKVAGAAHSDRTTYGYDLQGRLQTVRTQANPTSTVLIDQLRFTEVRYAYNEQGVRVASMQHEPTPLLQPRYTATTYLIDAHNPTGYASSIEDRTPAAVDVSPPATANTVVALTGVSAASQPSVSYAYGLQIVEQKSGSVLSYFGLDHQGTTRQMVGVDARATAIWYDAYGNFFDALGNAAAAPTTTTHLYAMLTFDPASKLHYALARFLDTGSGRFVSQDPYEGSLQNPLTLPKYWYAAADGVNNVDPSGLTFTLAGTLTITSGDPTINSIMTSPARANALIATEQSWELALRLAGLYAVPFKWVLEDDQLGQQLTYWTVSRAFDSSGSFKSQVLPRALSLPRLTQIHTLAAQVFANRTSTVGADMFWALDDDATDHAKVSLQDRDYLSDFIFGVDHIEAVHRVYVSWNGSQAQYYIDSVYFWRDDFDWRGYSELDTGLGWFEKILHGGEVFLDVLLDGLFDQDYSFVILYPRSENPVTLT